MRHVRMKLYARLVYGTTMATHVYRHGYDVVGDTHGLSTCRDVDLCACRLHVQKQIRN